MQRLHEPREGRAKLWIALPAIALAAVMPVVLTELFDRDVGATREVAVTSLGSLVVEHIDARGAAVAGLAQRFSGWEVLPPEALERSLVELAAVYTGFSRLFVADGNGRVIASFTREGGSPPARGQLTHEPSTQRRQAMAERSSRAASAPAVYATEIWIGVDESGSAIELGAAVPRPPGTEAAYVGADFDPGGIAHTLADAEQRTGVSLALVGTGARVLYPANKKPGFALADGWRSDLGSDLTLYMSFPKRRPLFRYGIAVGCAILLSIIVILTGKRRRNP